jgi:hypothetical protein
MLSEYAEILAAPPSYDETPAVMVDMVASMVE